MRRGVAAARLPAEGAGAAFQSRTHGSEPCVQRRAGGELLPQLGRFPENAARGGGARHGERAVRPPLRRVLRHRGGSGGGVRDLLLYLRRSGELPQDESGNPSFRGNRHPHGKGAADSVCRFRGGHQRHSSGEFLLYGRFPPGGAGVQAVGLFQPVSLDGTCNAGAWRRLSGGRRAAAPDPCHAHHGGVRDTHGVYCL